MTAAPRTRNQDDTDVDPWERQPQESPEAYAAFTTYRDQDRNGRSIRRAARTLAKSVTVVGGWSRTHGWVARVAAYDRHLDAITRAEAEEKAREMGRRQATQLSAASSALTAPLQALVARIVAARGREQDPFAGVSTKDLSRLATMAARAMPSIVEAERLVAGLSTVNVADGAPASVEEARRRAEEMTRSQLDDYLLGLDDGRRIEREVAAGGGA